MLVANSFDLWQKDAFFSAAEEVQQSADIMESSYRTWLRARREGWTAEHLDELTGELQMALGTAKWQLEEFERAVRMSYRSHGDDITIRRHSQFISTLEDQIALVEAALKETFEVERKKEFRWVNLDEEECDDFALFLSGNSQTSQMSSDKAVSTSLVNKKNTMKEDSSLGSEDCSIIQIPYQGKSALEIVIDEDNTQKNASVESTTREKGSVLFFVNSKGEDDPGAKGVVSNRLKIINWINQRLRGGHRSQRQHQMSPVLPVKSIRFILALMLTIFLVVPFLVYST